MQKKRAYMARFLLAKIRVRYGGNFRLLILQTDALR